MFGGLKTGKKSNSSKKIKKKRKLIFLNRQIKRQSLHPRKKVEERRAMANREKTIRILGYEGYIRGVKGGYYSQSETWGSEKIKERQRRKV